ncbi:GNAT family N-acetyltransferase [Pseudonocardia pini]|uniref:GNAT family N-acetyltransferase n=1 Tax=Pseudonocardia pini TaxID=2758030 RepID=UPI0015F055C2|nr:GNAT family N-acetyltransferase [Pseudonocardia pini]
MRPFATADLSAVLDLSVRAWAPVFAAVEKVLAGSQTFELMHPDWRAGQRAAVEATCTSLPTWVAEDAGTVAGFVAVTLHEADRMGEIVMIAVDPAYQRRGHAAAMVAFATDWLREQGMSVALIDTGADEGHAPARRVYEAAGYTPLPGVKYFKAL